MRSATLLMTIIAVLNKTTSVGVIGASVILTPSAWVPFGSRFRDRDLSPSRSQMIKGPAAHAPVTVARESEGRTSDGSCAWAQVAVRRAPEGPIQCVCVGGGLPCVMLGLCSNIFSVTVSGGLGIDVIVVPEGPDCWCTCCWMPPFCKGLCWPSAGPVGYSLASLCVDPVLPTLHAVSCDVSLSSRICSRTKLLRRCWLCSDEGWRMKPIYN